MHTLMQGVNSSLIFQFDGTMMVPLAGSTSPLGTKISKAAELKLAGMGSKNPASDSESEKINPHPLIPGPVLSDYRRNGTMNWWVNQKMYCF